MYLLIVGQLRIDHCACIDADEGLADVGFRARVLQQMERPRHKLAIERLC